LDDFSSQISPRIDTNISLIFSVFTKSGTDPILTVFPEKVSISNHISANTSIFSTTILCSFGDKWIVSLRRSFWLV
jgi:hypothetical protein